MTYPSYYTQQFHGYRDGNLCLISAVEQEIAGKAVGARNFPDAGLDGEEKLRASYEREMRKLGVGVPENAVILDMGCGTGLFCGKYVGLGVLCVLCVC